MKIANMHGSARAYSRIMTYLDGIPFGKFYFEIAIILRNSLMISSILFNSEACTTFQKLN